jgi:hypothetical protein
MKNKGGLMKLLRLASSVLCLALIAGLALLFEPATAQAAKRISIQNASGYPIDVVLVTQTYNGWRVRGWYAIAAYSYRNINFNDAGGQAFGYYAKMRGANAVWQGGNNDPAITIVSNSMNHDVRQQPNGNNQRRVRVRVKQGNSIKLTYNAPQQQQYRQSGWW